MSYAQDTYVAFSAGFDMLNMVSGSRPTNYNSSLDGIYQFSMVGQNIEGIVSYEHFQEIGFSKFSFGGGYHLPLYGRIFGEVRRTVFIPSLDVSLINRFDKAYNPKSHMTLGLNLALRWHLTDDFAVETQLNSLPRVDLKYRNEKSDTPNDLREQYRIVINGLPIVNSVYLKFIWVINLKQ